MRNFGSNKKWKHILQSKPVLAVLLVIVLVFAWSVFGFWGKMNDTSNNRELVANRVATLRAEKEKLSRDIAKLETDGGVEESIRDKFGLAKEGEGLIVIMDEPDPKDAEGQDGGGFWGFLKNLFR